MVELKKTNFGCVDGDAPKNASFSGEPVQMVRKESMAVARLVRRERRPWW
jgi:hypothetical protein